MGGPIAVRPHFWEEVLARYNTVDESKIVSTINSIKAGLSNESKLSTLQIVHYMFPSFRIRSLFGFGTSYVTPLMQKVVQYPDAFVVELNMQI